MDYFHSPAFSARVEELIAKHHVPGLAIALVHDGKVASAAYGKATLDPAKPCTPDTLFDIASSSKSFTGASVGLLVEDEKYPDVEWDAPLVKVLPPGDFVVSGEGYTEGITIDDMLGHRTGMARHDDSYLGINSATPDNARSVTRNLRNLQLAAPLRSKYIYNNMMFTVATYLVETKSGMGFADFLQQRIFGPLGMESTNLQPSLARAKGLGDRLATRYRWRETGQCYLDFEPHDAPEGAGAGSIVTSANDFIKYVRAMMEQSEPFSESLCNGILKARTIMAPSETDLPPYTSPVLVAAGWESYYYRGYRVIEHGGLITGSGSHHFFVPELKLGGVLLGNADNAAIVTLILAHELIDEVLQVNPAERPDWEQIQVDAEPDAGGITPTEEDIENKRQEICPGIKDVEEQERPLSAYTGDYWNVGYRGMRIEEKDGKLFMNASDRSMGFTIVFTHVCEQTKYIAYLQEIPEGGDDLLQAEFIFDGDKATKFGIDLDDSLEELIWFDRAPKGSVHTIR